MTAFAGRIPLRGGALPAFGERRGCAGAELSVAIAGTLDNARDLRRDLEAAGHECAAGDADVVAHAYECWGVACVERIEGPVAIAIHDPRNSLCLLSRDRAGFASVAYHVSPEAIAFGSSVGGVAALAGIAREVDPQAIDAYLSIGAVPAPASIYRGVRKLQPAHVLVATREGTHEVRRYFSFVPGTGWPGTEVATGRMAALLEDAVARAMERGDAGLLLSAGPDSAIVLASAASRGRPLPSFTFGFTGGYAEIDQAHRTADHFGVPHEAFRLEPRIAEILPAVVRGHDEPHGNPSALLWHHIKAETGKRVGTILSGDGADELFSGRDVHMVAGPAETVHRTVPAPLLAAGARAAGKRPMAEKFFRGAALPVEERGSYWMSAFPPRLRSELYTPDLASAVEMDRHFEALPPLPSHAHPLERTFVLEVGLWIPEVLLATVRTPGPTVRMPFLDHRVVALAATVPPRERAGWGSSKRFLRRVYAARLPEWLREKRRRGGTKIPVGRPLRGDLRPLFEETVLSRPAIARGWFDPAVVRRLLDEHARGERDHASRLWFLLALELWVRAAEKGAS